MRENKNIELSKMSSQYITGYSRSATTLSSGGKDSLRFSVVNTLDGILKQNPIRACNYYPNWWKTSSCCDNPCPIGSANCEQNLINTCPNYDADNAQANSSSITSVIGAVNKVLDETEGDIDDETADQLIALLRRSAE